MTPTELKAMILGLDDGTATRTAAKLAFAEARDADCADLLNLPSEPGYVSRRDLAVTLAAYPQVDGLLKWVLTLGTMPAELGGGAAPFAFYCLCASLNTIAHYVPSASDTDIQLLVPRVTAAQSDPGVAALVTAGAIPPAFFTDLLAKQIEYSILEARDLARVTAADVEAARKS